MDMPPPLATSSPPALVVKLEPTLRPAVCRVCDENGCRLVRGFPNPIPNAPAEAPQPMPQVELPRPLLRPLASFATWLHDHRPRLIERLFARRR